ncbi:hypothetical protein MOQ72_37330 [Saccharopolyspora sp. K220]|uniref:hypothetical protein n=1 Tax=Saccharopolyspora soli TaxID=2926618 RepID=UPI001F594087|nr:hypothetical protein [Saccharopolyspora soli]MCI2423096.1 hypothetical protein [Saccharopolyspora soli]
MSATVITVEDIIGRYADDIAFVAEATPAAELGAFIDQLDTAAWRFGEARINGHEDMETAAVHLRGPRPTSEARDSVDETARNVFLKRADELLFPVVWDMTQENRDMVGD